MHLPLLPCGQDKLPRGSHTFVSQDTSRTKWHDRYRQKQTVGRPHKLWVPCLPYSWAHGRIGRTDMANDGSPVWAWWLGSGVKRLKHGKTYNMGIRLNCSKIKHWWPICICLWSHVSEDQYDQPDIGWSDYIDIYRYTLYIWREEWPSTIITDQINNRLTNFCVDCWYHMFDRRSNVIEIDRRT